MGRERAVRQHFVGPLRWVCATLVGTTRVVGLGAALPAAGASAAGSHGATAHKKKKVHHKKHTPTSSARTAVSTVSGTGLTAATIELSNGGTINARQSSPIPFTKTITKPNVYLGLKASTTAHVTLTCSINIGKRAPVTKTASGAGATAQCTATDTPASG